MKRIKDALALTAVTVALSALLQGCAMEAPFGDGGEGSLTISTEMNGDVKLTRGVPENNDYLREKCIVYIENSRGVMRKYKGVDNIPESIRLSSGDYVCNAWSGDSVPASFSEKFYRGQQHFSIMENQNTSLKLKCNIANVVTSVDPSALDLGLKDLQVKFSTSRGELLFDSNNIASSKGYFMTPSPETKLKDPEKYAENTLLTVTITATKEDGTKYEKVSTVKDVQRAHEYCVNISKEDRPIDEGGALISIVIKDIPIIEDTIEVFSAPAIDGVGFNIDEQVVNTTSSFKDVRVYLRGYYGLSSVVMNFSDNFTGFTSGQNVLTPSVTESLAAKGILVERQESVDAESGVTVDEVYVTFKTSMLNALAASDNEYAVTFEATDGRHLVSAAGLHIANTQNAIAKQDDAVADKAPDSSVNPMALLARQATLTGTLYKQDAADYGFKYRKSGASEWLTASAKPANGSRRRATTRVVGTPYAVTIKGLEPGTTYEYKAYVDDFESKTVQTFATESPFTLPNASMEEWSTYNVKTMLGYKDVPFAGSGDATTFWDSGNEGASTANQTLTFKSTDMVHSGTYSVRLGSKKIFGMIAAGNLFVGDYVKTDGTNGVLALGRPYNGSHPSKVSVWANYRPGKVDIIKSGNEEFVDFATGDNDHGQIYVALTVGTVEIRTNPENRKLFNPDDEQVLAYGQITWKDAFGPDGQLKKIDIPFTYNERAKTTKPTHLVIVCCASKFGDFFSGSSSSVLYLDDFELVYE